MQSENLPQFLALTSPGIEILLADELTELGAVNVVQKPEGVYFNATLTQGYNICLWTRLASRVLLQLHSGAADSRDSLFERASEINWSKVFNEESSFAIDFVGKSKEIRNSQFGALTVKDAIVDHFRDKGLARPNVDKHQPDIRFQARLLKGEVKYYLDFSGRGLFQRGYRQDSGAAPLKENLAAAIVKRSGWLSDTEQPLLDPMCGSGTLLIEAVSMAANYAPGVDRDNWGFEAWLGHSDQIWKSQLELALETSNQGLAALNLKVYGSDLDPRVIKTAKLNAKKAGLSQYIEFTCESANALQNRFSKKGTLLFNPPYGERIGELPELVETFTLLGQQLKQSFENWTISIFTANKELLSLLKLTSFKKYKFKKWSFRLFINVVLNG